MNFAETDDSALSTGNALREWGAGQVASVAALVGLSQYGYKR